MDNLYVKMQVRTWKAKRKINGAWDVGRLGECHRKQPQNLLSEIVRIEVEIGMLVTFTPCQYLSITITRPSYALFTQQYHHYLHHPPFPFPPPLSQIPNQCSIIISKLPRPSFSCILLKPLCSMIVSFLFHILKFEI